jgi:putative ABC transport system permease protein
VFRDGGRMIVAGLVIGLPAALVTTRLIQSLLYGVQPWDPLALSGAIAVLAATVTAATLVPAWRATRISPSSALRETL